MVGLSHNSARDYNMPKATTPTSGRHGRRHNPLEEDILATGILKSKPSKGKNRDDDEERAQFVESKASKKILRLGRELAEEDRPKSIPAAPSRNAFDPEAARRLDLDDDDEPEEAVFEDETFGDDVELQEEFGGEIEVDDLETFNKFLPSGDENPLSGWLADGKADDGEAQGSGTNLADLILAKIAEHEAKGQNANDPMAAPFEEDYELPPKVVEAFTKYVLPRACAKGSRLTLLKNRADTLAVQIGTFAKGFQDSPHDPALGRYSARNQPGSMVTKCLVSVSDPGHAPKRGVEGTLHIK